MIGDSLVLTDIKVSSKRDPAGDQRQWLVAAGEKRLQTNASQRGR